MLKFLVLVLIVIGVIAFFMLRQTPKRPPRDWRRGSDDPGPVLPGTVIGHDTGRKSPGDTSADSNEKVTGDTVSAGSDGAGGDGGGGGGD